MYILYVQILWDHCISFYVSVILNSVGENYKNGSKEPGAGPFLERAEAESW
jgi:hypothetical protein